MITFKGVPLPFSSRYMTEDGCYGYHACSLYVNLMQFFVFLHHLLQRAASYDNLQVSSFQLRVTDTAELLSPPKDPLSSPKCGRGRVLCLSGFKSMCVFFFFYLLPLQPLLLLLDVQLLSLLSLPLRFSLGSQERLLPLKKNVSNILL